MKGLKVVTSKSIHLMVEYSEPLGLANPEIREIEAPMERLVCQMAPEIAGGVYDLLIGDDTSGRIPTLVMRRVINAFLDRPVLTSFVRLPGAFWRTQEMLQREKDHIKRALFVTEHIASGTKLGRFARFFNPYGIGYDIATVSMLGEEIYYRELSSVPDRSRIFSTGNRDFPGIYRKPHLVGLEIAKPMCRTYDWKFVSPFARSARVDVATLSERLIDRLKRGTNDRNRLARRTG